MQRVLLLLSKTSYRTSDFLLAAEKLGIDVVIGSDQENLLAEFSGNRFVALDFYRPTEAAKAVQKYADIETLDAIIPVDEVTTATAAAACEILGLEQNPVAAISTTGNKYRFRQFLKHSKISNIGFSLIDRDADIAAIARKLPFPVVLKPLMLSGSRGVIRVNNDNEFGAAIDRIGAILDSLEDVAEAQSRKFILAEEYIPGAEIALECLVENGQLKVLAIFDKPDPLEGPYFEETIYVTPSRLPEDQLQSAIAVTERAIAALGLIIGPVHAEIRLNKEDVQLVELAPRSIGGLCSRVLELGTGQSLEEIILQQVVGMIPDTESHQAQPAGVMMIPIPKKGILKSVWGREEALSVDGITDITISIPRGGNVVPLPEGNRYLGFIFAKGDSPEIVEQSLRHAHGRLKFEIS